MVVIKGTKEKLSGTNFWKPEQQKIPGRYSVSVERCLCHQGNQESEWFIHTWMIKGRLVVCDERASTTSQQRAENIEQQDKQTTIHCQRHCTWPQRTGDGALYPYLQGNGLICWPEKYCSSFIAHDFLGHLADPDCNHSLPSSAKVSQIFSFSATLCHF